MDGRKRERGREREKERERERERVGRKVRGMVRRDTLFTAVTPIGCDLTIKPFVIYNKYLIIIIIYYMYMYIMISSDINTVIYLTSLILPSVV